jgi:signal transduction histidine kinase
MRRGFDAVVVGVGALAVVALVLAARSVGGCRSSVLVDPFLGYSAVVLPGWAPPGVDLLPGDVLTLVRDVPASAAELERAINEACFTGETSVTLSFGTRHLNAPVGRWTPAEVWWFFGLFVCFGGLFVWSAWLLSKGDANPLARRSYQLVAVLGGVFAVVYFDYHSSRQLVPCFVASSFGLPFGILLLACSFPTAPARLRRLLRHGPLGIGVACGVVAGLSQARVDLGLVRALVNVLVPASLLVLALVMLARWWRGAELERAAIRTAVAGLVVMPVLAGGSAVAIQIENSGSLSTILPLLGFVVPGSIGWSMLRADVFEENRVVSRSSLVLPTLLMAAAMGGSVAAMSGSTGVAGLVVFLSCAGVSGGLLWLALQRFVFRSRARFKPIVEALTREVANARDPDAIEAAIRRAVAAFLPEVRVVFRRAAADDVHVPMRSVTLDQGVVVLERPPSTPLLTDDDFELARVLATIGGLALHNARVLSTVDAQRDLERQSAEVGRVVALDAVAAELAHELTYPLAYFRHFFAHPEPTPDRVEVGREEVARLERMVNDARRMQRVALREATVSLRSLALRAQVLLEPQLQARAQTCIIEVAPDVTVEADADLALQLLANLLRNASDAAPAGGSIGVAFASSGATSVLSVWDNGPGVSPDAQPFVPFRSTRPAGMGLGLTVCQRIARSHGWTLQLKRRGERTCAEVGLGEGGSAR